MKGLDPAATPDIALGQLTIVLPTYNHGHYIGPALDSVFAQTRQPDRVLLLDDGSTDNTAEVIQPYLNRVPRIDYVRMPSNRGVVAMLNAGLAMTETEFVLFLAADDMLAPEAVEQLLAALIRNPKAAVCGMFARLIDEAGIPLHRPRDFDFGDRPRYVAPDECLLRLYRDGGLFGGNGATYRTGLLKNAGGFSPDLMSFCDGFRIQDLALRHGVCIVPAALALWRQRSSSYAAIGRSHPDVSLAILEAVSTRLNDPRTIFPRNYGARLVKRLRYAAALAALATDNPSLDAVRKAIGKTRGFFPGLLTGLRRFAGLKFAASALALYLRPFDIVPGLLRRIRS
jgi:hypothetical protein